MTNITYTFSLTTLAQAYGSGIYGCGNYEEGCATAGTTPSAPNTGMLLTEPSFVIPGSLLLAVLIALVTTGVARVIRRKRRAQI